MELLASDYRRWAVADEAGAGRDKEGAIGSLTEGVGAGAATPGDSEAEAEGAEGVEAAEPIVEVVEVANDETEEMGAEVASFVAEVEGSSDGLEKGKLVDVEVVEVRPKRVVENVES